MLCAYVREMLCRRCKTAPFHLLILLLTLGFATLLSSDARATLYLEEGFNYSTGNLSTPWTAGGTGIQVANPNLTLAGLNDTSPSGNKLTVTSGASRTQGRNFTATPITSGTVYCSFLIQCTTLPTASQYVIGLVKTNTLLSGSADPIILYVTPNSSSGFCFKINHSGNNQTATNVLTANALYFVVLKYTFGGGGKADLFFDTAAASSEPVTPNATVGPVGSDPTDLTVVSIKAQSATNQGTWDIDTIRVGSTWADVTPSSAPVTTPYITQAVFTASSAVLRGTNGTPNGPYHVITSSDLLLAATNWPAVSASAFDASGNFISTNPLTAGSGDQFFRVRAGTPTAPTISTPPQNLTVGVGQSANFNVVASGAPLLSYQWLFNTNTPLSGATDTALSLINVQTNDAGKYSVAVTNFGGSVTSVLATLTVLFPPTITNDPADQTVVAGQNATFSGAATGSAPLAYQWFFANSPIAGATSATLTLTNVGATNAGTYQLEATNAVGVDFSLTADLTVLLPPAITTQPQSQNVQTGQVVNLTVVASGTLPLSYQWRFNTNSLLLNATNASFTLTNFQATNAGNYQVVITNIAGSITSAPAVLTVSGTAVAPTITTQPTNQTVNTGQTAAFSVVASGTAPLSYQWRFNTNTVLVGATNALLTLTNVQNTNAGVYSVIVTNVAGGTTSAVASLTISAGLVAGAYFVATNGSDSNPGTLASPYKTISKGLTAISTSGIMYLRGGTYALPSKLSLSKAGTTSYIRIWAYPGETPVIDSTGNSSDGISISGSRYYFKGIEQRFAGHNGFVISGKTNILEFCRVHENTNTGIHITGGSSDGITFPAYNLITNCDSYMNFDGPIGGNADGFSAKWQVGPGNIFSGCRSFNNSDDGWDFWMANSTIVIENCWAFRNGSNIWASATFDGNGNGFKVGGNYIGTSHIVRNCVSFENAKNGSTSKARGFDENNNLSGQTLYNCTAYKNDGEGYYFNNTITNGNHTFRNCIAYQDTVTIASTSGHATVADHNTWNSGFSVSAADFQSLDTSGATNPRNADGTLPSLPLLHLAPGSALINAGTNVGLPYNGSAPDLGAFESP